MAATLAGKRLTPTDDNEKIYYPFKNFRSKFSSAGLALLYGFGRHSNRQVTGLNRNSVNRLLQGIRERIALACEAESAVSGEVKLTKATLALVVSEDLEDEEAGGKPLFLASLQGKAGVYTTIVSDCFKDTLQGNYAWACKPGKG